STRSRSTSPGAAWGNRDVRARPGARGGRVHRLPLPLGAGPAARPRARGPAPLRRRDQQVERPGTAGEVTGDGPVVLASDGVVRAAPAGDGRLAGAGGPRPRGRSRPRVARAAARPADTR